MFFYGGDIVLFLKMVMFGFCVSGYENMLLLLWLGFYMVCGLKIDLNNIIFGYLLFLMMGVICCVCQYFVCLESVFWIEYEDKGGYVCGINEFKLYFEELNMLVCLYFGGKCED